MEDDIKIGNVTYNKTKLLHFKNSPFILQKYKDADIDDIYKAIQEDRKLFSSYNMCMVLRGIAEMNRRKKVNTGLDMSSIQFKLKMKERHDALESLKTRATSKTAVSPTNMIGKDYTRLFDSDIDEQQWNDIELQVRKMFLQELNAAQQEGGCSGCKRNALIRKYIKKVQELLA